MIDPVIFTIGNFSLRWYGVIVMLAVIAGSLIAERELRRRGEHRDLIWDALVWWVPFGPRIHTPLGRFQFGLPLGVLPAGIVGARLCYVFNAILGGNRSYIEDPSSILRVWEGGLHIFGGFVLGMVSLLFFLRANKLDPWLFLDAAGPAALIGQGIGRLANFINQELYGPPTTLPWGIPIAAEHRLPQFQGLPLATRFHPNFAYEMLWNFATAGILLWLARRYDKELKPGTIFAGWLLAAGIGRTWLELFFRTDQPLIPGTGISYSAVFAMLMAIAGAVMLMVRYKALNLGFAEDWEEEYQVETTAAQVASEAAAEEDVTPRTRKAPGGKATVKGTKGKLVRRVPRKGTKAAPRTKKSS